MSLGCEVVPEVDKLGVSVWGDGEVVESGMTCKEETTSFSVEHLFSWQIFRRFPHNLMAPDALSQRGSSPKVISFCFVSLSPVPRA